MAGPRGRTIPPATEPETAVHLGTANVAGRDETLLLSRRGEIALIDFDRGLRLRPLTMDTLKTTNANVIERHRKAFVALARQNYGAELRYGLFAQHADGADPARQGTGA
jgi:hypothetical protein